MMKKLLCVLLCLLLTASTLPAFADAEESTVVQRLILTAKEKLSISDEIMEFQDYYLNASDEGNTYTLYWTAKDENTYRSISVTLDEQGIISEYYLYEDKGNIRPAFAKYSAGEAEDAARAFIAGLDPAKLSETVLLKTEKPVGGEYSITFQRMHNGIPVAGNSLRCTVDCDTLQVMNYYANWTSMEFSEETPISAAEADKAFSDLVGYELFYQIVSEDYENTARLIYRGRYDEAVFIDAVTGEAVSMAEVEALYRNNLKAAMETAADSAGSSGGGASLSPEERALVEQVAQMLSFEEADALARQIPELGITQDFSLENSQLSRRQTGEYVIWLSYGTDEEKAAEGYSHKAVTLHAETGQLLDYYSGGFHPYEEATETEEIPVGELREKARHFLEAHYNEELAQMTEKRYFDKEQEGFVYLRQADGIPVYNNGATLHYDHETGELISFSLDWAEVDFPSAAEVQTVAAADETARAQGEYALRYVAIPDGEEIRGALVYNMESWPVLDAVTLSPLDYRLRPVADKTAPNYTDLAGHYAAERIEKLLDYGIFLPADENGCLRPEETVTQLDFLLLLDQVLWNGRYAADTENLYRYLQRQKILTAEEVNPEGAVQRLDGIRWLLCALDYGEFVKIPGIFRCPFGDVDEADAGVAAVAWGLGLVSGDGSMFYPSAALRRADAMLIIHNYMQQ